MHTRTYEKIIRQFALNHGYMNFAQLREDGVTVKQLKELESQGILERFARGWYWCCDCGYTKPVDYKYIEISKVNPRAVICMESACYLCGLLKKEPDVVMVATERTDRKKMELLFPIQRFYFQNASIPGEIRTKTTEFGSYRYYSEERSICDCLRMGNRLEPSVYMEVVDVYRQSGRSQKRIYEYAKALRGLRNVQEAEEKE